MAEGGVADLAGFGPYYIGESRKSGTYGSCQGAHDAATRLTVKSALNPMLWLTAITTPVLLGFTYAFDKSESLRPFCLFLVVGALSVPAVTLLMAIYLAVFRPEKLQSEDYQLRQQALLMMGRVPQPVDPKNIVAIANPVHKRDQEAIK